MSPLHDPPLLGEQVLKKDCGNLGGLSTRYIVIGKVPLPRQCSPLPLTVVGPGQDPAILAPGKQALTSPSPLAPRPVLPAPARPCLSSSPAPRCQAKCSMVTLLRNEPMSLMKLVSAFALRGNSR
jgi:hypothetical protein